MKTANPTNEKIHRVVFTVLLSIVCVLVLLLIVGTIFGVARSPNAPPLFRLGNAPETEWIPAQTDDIRIFSGLERIRIPLSDSSVLVLSIAFPYSANDIAFSEELAARVGDFREIARDYFSSIPQADPAYINDEAARQELLRRFNGNLRLGQITTLYFSDMLIIN